MAKVRWGPFTIESDVKKAMDAIIKAEQEKDRQENKSVRKTSPIIESLLRKLIRESGVTARV